jgi:O-antigen ligase
MSSPKQSPGRLARLVRSALDAAALVALAGLLSADLWWNVGLPLGLEWWRVEVAATLADPGIARLLALGLALHAALWTAYAASEDKKRLGASRLRTVRDAALCVLAVGVGALAWRDYGRPQHVHPQALHLLFGLLLAALFRLWRPFEFRGWRRDFALGLGLLLAAAGWWPWHWRPDFAYRGEARFSGLWMNPNHAGILLGSLFLLGLACLATTRAGGAAWRGPAATARKRLRFGLAVALVGVAGVGLLATYSRGAILGTGLALALWLGRTVFRRRSAAARAPAPLHPAAHPFGWALLALGLTAMPLLGWIGRDSSQPALRRALSWSNPDDFSWRNRVEFLAPAWSAIRERPWAGWGAGRLEAEVAGWHAPLHRPDSRAHGLNGPVQLAGTWGLPLAAALALAVCAAFALTLRSHAPAAHSDWALGLLALPIVGLLLQGTLAHGPSGLLCWLALATAGMASAPKRREIK